MLGDKIRSSMILEWWMDGVGQPIDMGEQLWTFSEVKHYNKNFIHILYGYASGGGMW
jgi:hypothetical protein